MPTLFRFLMIVGVIAGVVTGSLYVLAEYFQPEPKEISKALRNVKGRVEETAASTPSGDTGAAAATSRDDVSIKRMTSNASFFICSISLGQIKGPSDQ